MHGLRRRLSEPSPAGQSLCSSARNQRSTCSGVSRGRGMRYMCHITHIHVKLFLPATQVVEEPNGQWAGPSKVNQNWGWARPGGPLASRPARLAGNHPAVSLRHKILPPQHQRPAEERSGDGEAKKMKVGISIEERHQSKEEIEDADDQHRAPRSARALPELEG